MYSLNVPEASRILLLVSAWMVYQYYNQYDQLN